MIRSFRPLAPLLGLLAFAIALTALVHGRTLAWRWHWDDYHQVRPYSLGEVAHAFGHSWDPTGAEPVFYRPLAVAFFAARYGLFGTSAFAHHALSLALTVAAAFLLGLLARRLSGSMSTAYTAAALFVAHPNTPASIAVWATNHPHGLALCLGLAAALLVLDGHDAGAAALAALAALLKEDGLVLYPWLYVLARLVGRRPSLAFYVVPAVALIALRTVALGQIGGYGLQRSAELHLAHALRGPLATLFYLPGAGRDLARLTLVPAAFVGPLAALVLHTKATLTLGVALAERPLPNAVYAGLAGVALFNLPLVAGASKPTAWHWLIAMSSLVLAEALPAASRAMGGARIARHVIAATFLATAAFLSAMGAAAFAPCATITSAPLRRDVEAWIAAGLVHPDLAGDFRKLACSAPPDNSRR